MLFLACLLFFIMAGEAMAIRSATSLRSSKPGRFAPIAPVSRDMGVRSFREVVPIPVKNAREYVTEHFRILWGNNYDRYDPDWNDPDGDTIPTWVEVLADALESSHAIQSVSGFPDPYGMSQYYPDVYVANTGISVYDEKTDTWNTVTLSSDYYAYTEIDPDYHVAYFVFNDDFSIHTDAEQSVLRVTAAHELFHAVQRVYYPWDDEQVIDDVRWAREMWWFESTCTWMEEICYGWINDYATYVKLFLAHPESPLESDEGVREYGAAIFPGFLWLNYGESAIWKAVFEKALDQGVESAVSAALAENGCPPLADVLAMFWSLSAHPEDFWPDGHLFRDAASPRILNPSPELPAWISTTASNAPARHGANLFHFSTNSLQTAEMMLEKSNPGAAWRVGVSVPGSASVAVWAPDANHPKVFVEAESEFYIAMVNVSALNGAQLYGALFRQPPASPLAGDLNGDAILSLEDCIIGLQILSGITPSLPLGIQPKDYSVMGDGKIGIADGVYILQALSEQRGL